jgi:hypothetical protein
MLQVNQLLRRTMDSQHPRWVVWWDVVLSSLHGGRDTLWFLQFNIWGWVVHHSLLLGSITLSHWKFRNLYSIYWQYTTTSVSFVAVSNCRYRRRASLQYHIWRSRPPIVYSVVLVPNACRRSPYYLIESPGRHGCWFCTYSCQLGDTIIW